MAIGQMRRVQIYTHGSHRASLIKDLQDLEIIHINNLNEQSESTSEVPAVSELRNTIRNIQNDLSRLQSAIDYLADFEPKKGLLAGMMGSGKIVLSSQEYANIAKEAAHGEWQNICIECESLQKQTAELNSREGGLRSDKEHLLLWSNLDAPIEEIKDTEKVAIRMGAVPVNICDILLSELRNSDLGMASETVGGTKNETYLVVIFLKEDEQKAAAILTKYGFSPVSLPFYSGRITEQLKRIEVEFSEISNQRKQIAEKSAQLAAYRAKLMSIYDHLTELLRQEEVREKIISTEHTFMVDGWVRRSHVKKLEDELPKKYEELEIVVSEPSEDDEPPIYLENKPGFSPFRMVTGLYGLPGYNGVDPSPLFAPFFTISLGICLGDAGYGICIILLAYFISRRIFGSGKDLMKIFIIAASAAILVGLITGSWFGIDSKKLPSFLTSIQLFDPLSTNGQLIFMGIVITIGFIQVGFGFFVKIRMYIEDRDWVGAFCEQFPWLFTMILMPITAALYITKAMPAATTAAMVLIGLCLLILVLFAGRANKNLGARIAAGLFDLYGRISGILGDTLSYMRLFALGLSSAIFAGVVNTMAGILWGNPIGKVAAIGLLVGGHAFNLIMSCLSGFIHTTRLQFVEFFTKFYESGGREFRPFKKEHAYITVVNPGNPENK